MTTLDERRALTNIDVTLDGAPARITGARLLFGSVVRLDNGHSVPFAWPTIARVVERGGRFQS